MLMWSRYGGISVLVAKGNLPAHPCTAVYIKVLNRGDLMLVLYSVLEIWLLSEARHQMSKMIKPVVRGLQNCIVKIAL